MTEKEVEMRIVVGMDWSEQAFTAVQTVTQLYTPSEMTLVHGVDLREFESPVFAPAMAKRAFEELRRVLVDAGRQLLDQAAALIPAGIPVKRVCEVGSPASVVLDAAEKAHAKLLVTGARGRGRIAETILGSVSHRVLTHARCSVLIVKRPIEKLRRVLVGLDPADESDVVRRWLGTHPFSQPAELRLISAVPRFHPGDPISIPAFNEWRDAAIRASQDTVTAAAAELSTAGYTATGTVVEGDPAEVIARESDPYDLVIVGSHGRKGLERFLLGSVSHHVTHRVSCPVLVVRPSGHAS
jgi:nucleotide-binding universal stress UspA family protein